MAGVDPGASSITVAGSSSLPRPFLSTAVMLVMLTFSSVQFECDLLLSEKPPNCMLIAPVPFDLHRVRVRVPAQTRFYTTMTTMIAPDSH